VATRASRRTTGAARHVALAITPLTVRPSWTTGAQTEEPTAIRSVQRAGGGDFTVVRGHRNFSEAELDEEGEHG